LTPDKKRADQHEASLRLKPKQLFARIEELRQKGEATFSYKLFDEYPVKSFEEKMHLPSVSGKSQRFFDASKTRENLEPAKYEIDLHIEKLTDKPGELNNFEKLTLQLKTFEKYLDLAIAHHQSAMIVIHGIGSGKLRDELHEILRLRKGVKSFVNQYHPAYGYRATEIFFEY